MHYVISSIKQLLEASIAAPDSVISKVKRVFYGDPIKIAESLFPAIAVHPLYTDIVPRGSQYDSKVHYVEIRLIYNAKDYYEKDMSGTSKTITAATYDSLSSHITFNSIAHGFSSGDKIVISGVVPDKYNGPYVVVDSAADTFEVISSIDPGTYVSGGMGMEVTDDTVYAVKDAIMMLEQSVNHEIASTTITGTIQKNMNLPYTVGSETTNAADVAKVTNIEYKLNDARGFPTFEVIARVEATVIGDR